MSDALRVDFDAALAKPAVWQTRRLGCGGVGVPGLHAWVCVSPWPREAAGAPFELEESRVKVYSVRLVILDSYYLGN